MLRKLLSGVLCAALLFGLCGYAALAEGPDDLPANDSKAVHIQDYIIGFVSDDGSGGHVSVFDSGSGINGMASGEPLPDETWQPWVDLKLGAYTHDEPSNVYTPAGNVSISVKSMGIQTLSGSSDALSFASDELITSSSAHMERLYLKSGCAAEALVSAELEISVSGQTPVTGTVSLGVTIIDPGPAQFALYTTEAEGDLLAEWSTVCYYELNDGSVWLRPEAGLSDADKDQLEAWANSTELDLAWNNDKSAAKITLPEPEVNSIYTLSVSMGPQQYILRVTSSPVSSAAHIELGGQDCVVGFYDSGSLIFDEGSSLSFSTGSAASSEAPRKMLFGLDFAAGTYTPDFELVEGVDIAVKSMEIITVAGSSGAFSFSAEDDVFTFSGAAEALYCREGVKAIARVTAELEISAEGMDAVTATVSLGVSVNPSGLSLYTSEAMDEASRVAADSTVDYFSLTDGCLWLHSASGFEPNFKVESDYGEAVWTESQNNTVKIQLPEPDASANSYGLHISNGPDHMSVIISCFPEGSCIRIQNGSNEYIVGFAFGEGEDGVTIISEGNWSYGNTTTEAADPDNPRILFREMAVDVGLRKEDAQGNAYYELDKTGPVSVRVLSMEVQHFYGECEGFDETFSFAESGQQVTRVESPEGNSADIYVKRGYDATALVTAEVEVTVGGSTQTGSVSMQLHIDRGTQQTMTRPENDTVGALNAALEEMAQELPEGGTGFVDVYLTADSYEGTIVIPEEFITRGSYELTLMSIMPTDRTAIIGGIDLNNSRASVRDLDFIAPGSGSETKAIWNGCSTTVQNSSFQGYDVAIDASVNTINPRYCVFVDNVVAARIDLPESTNYSARNDWYNNVFINNGTAVQVLGLNEFVSPYYFRVTGSNFVGNSVAFDVRCEGTVYFYRNYYGEVKNNAQGMTASQILEALRDGGSKDIQKQPPVVSIADHSSTKVVTNPRWNEPVKFDPGIPSLPAAVQTLSARASLMAFTLAAPAQESTNYLTADWELPTEIVIGEDGLELNAAAFAEASGEERIISVVDQNGKLLGVWNFGTEAHEGLSGSFDAAFGLTEREDGSLGITINDEDGLLEALKPTLTIPNASGGVEHEGGAVDSEPAEGGLSFTVAGGGSYEISEEVSEPEEPDEPEVPDEPDVPGEPDVPDTPVQPGVPVVPSEPAEPDVAVPDFDDVDEGAWYYDSVAWVCGAGLMEGSSESAFEPEATMTRAMVWAILARADGETVTGAVWADAAREWAMAEGVSDGTDLYGFVTREQFATMLWRYAGEPASEAGLGAYTDAGSVSAWAAAAMAWAVEQGIISGVTETAIAPRATATRAQAAVMLTRFMKAQ